uniref:PIN domain-containing protein n=1 Tax=Ignisphaera aggregans TaxID=334771 RepID=A0A7C4BCN1_9CREN
MESTRFLLDASAIYSLLTGLGHRVLDFVDMFSVLDLTVYEVGNAIWKNYMRGRIANIGVVVEFFEEFLSMLKRFSIGNEIEEVLRIAIENNLTFYDSAYLYTARKNQLKLVTEDQELLRFPETLNVKTLLKELAKKST